MNVPCRCCALLLGCAVSIVALGACSDPITGGQTGDGSEVLDPSAPTPMVGDDVQTSQTADCKGLKRRLEALDSDTPLGFSAAEVLAFAEGTFDTDIAWLPSDTAGFGFARETSNGLSLSVEAGDTASIVEFEAVDGGVPEGCEPYLVVPVTVSVESEGGALNETFETELRASTLDLATFTQSLPASSIEGSLELVDAPPGVELASVIIAGTVSPLGTLGRVSVTTRLDGEATSGDGELEAAETLAARWPAAACVGSELGYNEPGILVTSDQTVGQLDLAEALAPLSGRSPIALRWQADDGTETSASTLSAEFELGSDGCALESSGRFALAAPVRVHLASADGKLEANVDGRFDAQPGLDGALRWTSISVNFEAPAAEFAEQVQLNGINVDDYDVVTFWLNLNLDTTSDQLSGSLSISGQRSSSCVAMPEPETLSSCPTSLLGAGIGPIYKP